MYPVETVVEAMVAAAHDPKPEIYACGTGRLANISMKLMPGIIERKMTVMVHEQEVPSTSTPSTSGNLFEPADDEPRISGGWRKSGAPTPGGAFAKVAGVGAAVVAIVAISRRFLRRS